MREQVPDGDLPDPSVGAVAEAQPFKGVVFEPQSALLDQLHDSDCREGFGHTRNAKKRPGLDGSLRRYLGIAIAASQEQLAVVRNREGAALDTILLQKPEH